MAKQAKNAISPTREENYPQWYQQVVREAELAEASPVRGCMVIRPWGCALWENMQRALDRMFKDTGHRNAYFPLFIPKSFLEKEAQHVEGFAKECAVVTHHRLVAGPDGGLIPDPAAKLEEPLIVRPTSETIIGAMYAKWVQSYRDLPILINQWANVVRWELRTRLFLRTTEFLWQEGHTAHATEAEAREETLKMLGVYKQFAEQYMAMPVLTGRKTDAERFPGAIDTWCIEAMMQDRKALQAGTSHFLGQNFAKASEIRFLDENGSQQYAWTTSWGVSTRLIGGLVMTHGDDDGLILPPMLAPAHVVIMPITFKADDPQAVMNYCLAIRDELRRCVFGDRPIEVEIDDRDLRGGEKVWSWVKKGVPIRLEVGPRDMADDAVFMARRDQPPKDKQAIPRQQFIDTCADILGQMQNNLFERARAFRAEHTHAIDNKEEFERFFTPPTGGKGQGDESGGGAEGPTPIHGGFALAHYNGDPELEDRIARELGVTVRCIPDDGCDEAGEPGACIFTGEPSPKRVVWAKSY
jgi:prolyl-tRNA synthetase